MPSLQRHPSSTASTLCNNPLYTNRSISGRHHPFLLQRSSLDKMESFEQKRESSKSLPIILDIGHWSRGLKQGSVSTTLDPHPLPLRSGAIWFSSGRLIDRSVLLAEVGMGWDGEGDEDDTAAWWFFDGGDFPRGHLDRCHGRYLRLFEMYAEPRSYGDSLTKLIFSGTLSSPRSTTGPQRSLVALMSYTPSGSRVYHLRSARNSIPARRAFPQYTTVIC